jgi:hypothetical protein
MAGECRCRNSGRRASPGTALPKHEGLAEVAARSAVRSIGSSVGREIIRGVLGGIFGSGSRKR